MKGWLILFVVILVVVSAIIAPFYFSNKRYPKITLEQYSHLEIGMTVEEAVEIAEKPGYLASDKTTTLYSKQEYEYREKFRWTFRTLFNPPQIVLHFINGRLEEKYWNK
ncbi:hypothetical protein [Paenibacillus ginsengarvi]|uniref:Uncharacterized protein n=1 Tax=Paenibacillus ginsengarvi TaxID=400777 RepID=A0A3B0BRC9_9BACL|nr:hypothetical protein [Paenibacillus ginsengarvi]RKN75833.1 hypothetical protein D7M11_25340 [Paenibacillus ginsengarvi]